MFLCHVFCGVSLSMYSLVAKKVHVTTMKNSEPSIKLLEVNDEKPEVKNAIPAGALLP